MSDYKKTVEIIGGGTFSHLRNHLALSAPAFGTTAIKLAEMCKEHSDKLNVNLHLTKMADRNSKLETNKDVEKFVDTLIANVDTKIIFFNAALCDYDGAIVNFETNHEHPRALSDISESKVTDDDFPFMAHLLDLTESGKHETRLKTSRGNQIAFLQPADKVISKIRKTRKDIFLVAFKTTTGASDNEQYIAGLRLLKQNSCNLVLANDTVTRRNMIITPEESRYGIGNVPEASSDRDAVLRNLVEMAYLRSHLSFTRSTVVSGESVDWNGAEVPDALRTVVNHCIKNNAYKEFNGATVGHFACKVNETTFLTSKRKTNFNDLSKLGLVKVVTDGPDSVIAYGAKPSVGGQSQRLVFKTHQDCDCIVHFHCPKIEGSLVPTMSQREYECGSHQCGQNTATGLQKFGNLYAVYLDNHGPNIVFNHDIDPNEVIDFIESNFDLSSKTGGPVKLKYPSPMFTEE